MLAATALCLGASCGRHALKSTRGGQDAAARGQPDVALAIGPDTEVASQPDAPEAGQADESTVADSALPDSSAEQSSILGLDAAVQADAPESLDAGPPDSQSDTVRDTEAECPAWPALRPGIPSRQRVSFHFVSSSPAYLVTDGLQCGPFAIARIDAEAGPQSVLLVMPAVCICECPRPAAPGVSSLIPLNQSSATVLSWDATELQPYQFCVDCGARGGYGVFTFTYASSAPVGPGRYRATFSVMDVLPPNCHADPGGARCDTQYDFSPPSVYCPVARTLSVEFELPPSGDLDVTVVDQG